MDSSINTPIVSPNLAMLPLELLINVTFYLSLKDYVNLQASCKGLRASLKADEACCDYIKDCMQFTFEADLARKGLIDYNTAIQRTYLTNMRLELVKPYSVIVLGHVNHGYWAEGLLLYSLGDFIRVLDVYNAAVTEDVIDVRSLLGEEAERSPQHIHDIQGLLSNNFHIEMLHFGEGILAIGIHNSNFSSEYLVAINIRKGIPLQERLLMIRNWDFRGFVKTDGRYMTVFKKKHNSWDLELYDFEDKHQGMQKRRLPRFFGFGHGHLDHQIYDGWSYLLINDHYQQEGDAADYWNYYYCYRFPLDQFRSVTSFGFAGTEPLPEQLQVVRVKRQRPRSCPNDVPEPPYPWLSLKLCRDEYSGQLIIVEGGHHDGEECDAVNSQYTFQPLQFPESNSAIDTATSDRDFVLGTVQTLNPADLPRAEKDRECPKDPGDSITDRIYVPRASTFSDVYLGSEETPDSRNGFEFRLAVGSYFGASSTESESSQPDKISSPKLGGFFPDDNNQQHFVEGVRRFPPNGAPKALSDLLCPRGKLKWGVADNDIVSRPTSFSTKRLKTKLNSEKQLVLINFDPWIRFPGLETMVLHPLSTHLTFREYEDELARAKRHTSSLSEEEFEEKNKKEARETDKVDKVQEPKSPWFWTERAMYLDIHQGFQFS